MGTPNATKPQVTGSLHHFRTIRQAPALRLVEAARRPLGRTESCLDGP